MMRETDTIGKIIKIQNGRTVSVLKGYIHCTERYVTDGPTDGWMDA